MRRPTRAELAYLALGVSLFVAVALVLAGTLRPPPPTGVYLTQEHAESVTAAYDRLQENFTRLRSEADTNRAGLLFMLAQFGCLKNDSGFWVEAEYLPARFGIWSSPGVTNDTEISYGLKRGNYIEREYRCRSPLGDNLTVPFATAYGTGARRWELP